MVAISVVSYFYDSASCNITLWNTEYIVSNYVFQYKLHLLRIQYCIIHASMSMCFNNYQGNLFISCGLTSSFPMVTSEPYSTEFCRSDWSRNKGKMNGKDLKMVIVDCVRQMVVLYSWFIISIQYELKDQPNQRKFTVLYFISCQFCLFSKIKSFCVAQNFFFRFWKRNTCIDIIQLFQT